MGLAWTAMGGTSLYIETSAVLPRYSTPLGTTDSSDVVSRAGVGALRMTGQMGGVMQVCSSNHYTYYY
jgi:ATP-dependent Lon protease